MNERGDIMEQVDPAGYSQKIANVKIDPALQGALYGLLMDVINERTDSSVNCEIDASAMANRRNVIYERE